ncbi:MAG: hypothetical protein U0746_21230 [Gemmataceae bacterium]
MPAPPVYLDVDPATLHLPTSRWSGADPWRFQQQIIRFGASTVGMPPPLVRRGADGGLVVYNGVTRATRIAKLAPGTLIRVELTTTIRSPVASWPTIGDMLP